jgi:hypothetical protein
MILIKWKLTKGEMLNCMRVGKRPRMEEKSHYEKVYLQRGLVAQVPAFTPRQFKVKCYVVDSTRRLYWVLEGINHGGNAVESSMSTARPWPEDGLPPPGVDEKDIVLVHAFHGRAYQAHIR